MGNNICGEGNVAVNWTELWKAASGSRGYEFASSDGSEKSILVAAPVKATFMLENHVGTTTHYILSAVPTTEISMRTDDMTKLIKDSTDQILIITGIVAAATLVAVAMAVCLLSKSITRPIVKMTRAAQSIAKDRANTNVFGEVAREWGRGTSNDVGGTTCLDYLLCRGDDEIKTLEREFGLMITGLGRRGSAAPARGLENSSVYPVNPFTAPMNDNADATLTGDFPRRPVAPAT